MSEIENKIVRFEDTGITILTPEELASSVEYKTFNGRMPRNKPIEHHQLINDLMNLSSTHDPVLDPIYAHKSHAKQVMWSGAKDACPVKHFIFDRIITRIQFKNYGTNDVNFSIAVSYNESGIQVAYGLNVMICANMTIMGRSNIISTYGSEQTKVPFDQGMDTIRGWIANMEQETENLVCLMQNLKDYKLNREMVYFIFGAMLDEAVKQNTSNSLAPLSITQTSDFVRQFQKEDSAAKFLHEDFTAWDLINVGTAIMKPGKIDMRNHLLHNGEFVNFIKNHTINALTAG